MNKLSLSIFSSILLTSTLYGWHFDDSKKQNQQEERYPQRDNSQRNSPRDGYDDYSDGYDDYVDGNANPRVQKERTYTEYQDIEESSTRQRRPRQESEFALYKDMETKLEKKEHRGRDEFEQRRDDYRDQTSEPLYPEDEPVEQSSSQQDDTLSLYDTNDNGEDSENSEDVDISLDDTNSEDMKDDALDSYEDIYENTQSTHTKQSQREENSYRDAPKDTKVDDIFSKEENYYKKSKKTLNYRKPQHQDSDGDGVFDYVDRCNNTPRGVRVDREGCEIKKVIRKILTLKFFDRTSRIIYKTFHSIKLFSSFMEEHPKYKARIIGYTDSRGSAVSNVDLSKKRADAVKEALIIEGVDASRMITIGRGESNPLYSNKTKKGRDANNRIEVELYK